MAAEPIGGVDQVRLGWAALAASRRAAPDRLATEELNVRVDSRPCLLAVAHDGQRGLLVPVPAEIPGIEERGGEHVVIQTRRLGAEGEEGAFLEVRCVSPDLDATFEHLVADILNMLGSEEPPDPVAGTLGVLERWRELLRPAAGRAATRERLAGVFGELRVLERIVERDPARRIDSWIGPTSTRHDLRRADRAIEVKASLATSGRVVSVNGLDQLEPPDEGDLLLAWFRLESVPGGGESVWDVAERLGAIGAPMNDLLVLMAAAGAPPDAREEHSRVRFETREQVNYRVGPGFPRMTASDLVDGRPPAGVSHIKYRIDLASEPPTPLEATEVDVFIEQMAGAPSG
jgi:hypothetical protein